MMVLKPESEVGGSIPLPGTMLHDIEICWNCEDKAQSVTLYRCRRCLDLKCSHHMTNDVCSLYDAAPFVPNCASKEKKKVLSAWRNELNKSGICVNFNYRFDKCCEYLVRTDDEEWACYDCGKRVGKVPLPTSCAGCGGHSTDPDCPLHGKE